MEPLQTHLDARIHELIDEASSYDINSEEFTAAAKNLADISKVRTLLPEPEPAPLHVPTTRWGRIKATVAQVWDNETTRVFIKAGGAFGGVGLVVWSTNHKNNVLDREALGQANQRNS